MMASPGRLDLDRVASRITAGNAQTPDAIEAVTDPDNIRSFPPRSITVSATSTPGVASEKRLSDGPRFERVNARGSSYLCLWFIGTATPGTETQNKADAPGQDWHRNTNKVSYLWV